MDAEDSEEVTVEIDDGPGLGCTFPDRRSSKTISHIIASTAQKMIEEK